VPSNLILHRVGARLWIARIMITWGLISASMLFVRTPFGFYVLRFLLGVAEAGFFPGIIYYLGNWFPVEQRARAIAAFMMGIPLAGLVGGPLSGLLLELDGVGSLAGWQWLFLAEGLPAVLLGFIVLWVLPDNPHQASWLSPAEQESLQSRLAAERKSASASHLSGTRAVLLNGTVWRLGILFLLAVIGFYGYSIWSPLIIRALTGFTNLGVGFVSGAIALVTVICMLASSAHSDRTGERPLHVAIPHFIMACGFLGCAIWQTPIAGILALALVPVGHASAYGAFWSMPTRFLDGRAAAAGIALIASIVNVGGFLGPTIIGILKDRTGSHTIAFYVLAGLAAMSALMAFQLRGANVLQRPAYGV
jgi:ACS family tartrate transporter-like MFS transporter